MQSYSPGKVIGTEALAVSDRKALEAVLQAIAFPGVLVGAIQGPQPGDLRAVVLQSPNTYLIRVQPGNFAGDLNMAQKFGAYLHKLELLSHYGAWQGQLWTARRFYPKLLEELVSKGVFDQSHFSPLLRELLHTLRMFQEVGLCHGHISASNLALEALPHGKVNTVLLDGGYLPLNPAARQIFKRFDPSGLAPEVRESARFGIKADIYSFGVLARGLLRVAPGLRISSIQERLLQACSEGDPQRRPELREVEEAFFPEQALVRGGSATLLAKAPADAGSGLGAGRLIKPQAKAANSSKIESGARLDFVQTPRKVEPQPPKQVHVPGSISDTGSFRPIVQQSQTKASNLGPILEGRNSNQLWILLGIFALLAFGIWRYGPAGVDTGQNLDLDWSRQWLSNQPSEMREVAQAAVEDQDREARRVIEQDALAGVDRTQVNARFLRMALNPIWEADLTDDDRRLALYLGVIALLPQAPTDLLALEDAHPGIALALAASSPVSQAPKVLESVSIESISSLPQPFSTAMQTLYGVGVKNLAHPAALALSHILFGDTAPETLGTYFSAASDAAQQVGLLAALLPLGRANPSLPDSVYAALATNSGVLGQARGWFEADQTAVWAKTPKLQILNIMTGAVPVAGLGFEQLADLLSYPANKVRVSALQGLSKLEGAPELASTLAVLASEGNTLTRFQNVSLLLALQIKGEKGDAYISTWFKSSPAPEMVLNLLLARSDIRTDDFFNLEAARYLAGSKFDVDLEKLKKLMGHPEVMARALAVSRLDPRKLDQREVLEAMAVVEPSARIREQIKQRLR